MIEIGQSERSAILEKIHADSAGNVGKRSVPIVRIEHIPLKTAPAYVGANEFIDCIPSLFVIVRRA